MIEILSNPMWQGISVIVAIIIPAFGFVLRIKKLQPKSSGKLDSVLQLPITVEKEVFEGQLIRLRGKVWREMSPGTPNYESIDNGDQPQAYWILNTENPIEIFGKSPENDKPFSAGSSSRFQLKLDEKFYSSRAYTVFSDAWVEGRVIIGHTGHHKTKALIDVQKLELI